METCRLSDAGSENTLSANHPLHLQLLAYVLACHQGHITKTPFYLKKWHTAVSLQYKQIRRETFALLFHNHNARRSLTITTTIVSVDILVKIHIRPHLRAKMATGMPALQELTQLLKCTLQQQHGTDAGGLIKSVAAHFRKTYDSEEAFMQA